jgi:hypothetical protein
MSDIVMINNINPVGSSGHPKPKEIIMIAVLLIVLLVIVILKVA